jgi:hypothetical protein
LNGSFGILWHNSFEGYSTPEQEMKVSQFIQINDRKFSMRINFHVFRFSINDRSVHTTINLSLIFSRFSFFQSMIDFFHTMINLSLIFSHISINHLFLCSSSCQIDPFELRYITFIFFLNPAILLMIDHLEWRSI